MQMGMVETPISKIKAKAEQIAYSMAYEEITKKFGDEFPTKEPEMFYQELDRLVEKYTAILLAKEIEKLPIRTKGRGRPSKLAKEVREFLEAYEKAVETVKRKTKKVYYVFSWVESENPNYSEKALYPVYIGRFEDLETAIYEAHQYGGFILIDEDDKGFFGIIKHIRKEFSEKREKSLFKHLKALEKAIREKGVIRYIFKVNKAKDDFYIVYVPSMPTTLSPEFQKRLYTALFREYAEKMALNTKRDYLSGVIKIRRAKVPFVAEKVRKAELSYLAKMGKPDLSLKEFI